MGLRLRNPKFRSERCGLQTISFKRVFKDPASKSNIWQVVKSGVPNEKMATGCEIRCPGSDTVAASAAYATKSEALEDSRNLIAKLACGSCVFYGKTQTDVDYILAARSRARAERLQAEAQELQAEAVHRRAQAEVNAITQAIIPES